jgi:hypothetical protein
MLESWKLEHARSLLSGSKNDMGMKEPLMPEFLNTGPTLDSFAL